MTTTAPVDVSPARPALLSFAADRDDPLTLAVAGAIESAAARGLPATSWLRGLDTADCARMMPALFPEAAELGLGPLPPSPSDSSLETEFADLLQLLMEARSPATRETRWLACAIASAALFDNHLWQDLHLPNRRVLSALLERYFPALARRNTGNMRWKAFFYKQLCERAGMVCRAPSCGACDDYAECFGTEDAVL